MTHQEAEEKLKAWKIRARWEKYRDTLGPLPEKWAKHGKPGLGERAAVTFQAVMGRRGHDGL